MREIKASKHTRSVYALFTRFLQCQLTDSLILEYLLFRSVSQEVFIWVGSFLLYESWTGKEEVYTMTSSNYQHGAQEANMCYRNWEHLKEHDVRDIKK